MYNSIIYRMKVVVLSKLDINSLIYGCGHVIFCVYNLCIKTFFLYIERSIWPFSLYRISIDAESKYLSNESGFIEIGQKLIELWRWKGHVFPLQLVFSKVFSVFNVSMGRLK
jgi:hypothetical protein